MEDTVEVFRVTKFQYNKKFVCIISARGMEKDKQGEVS